MTQLLDGKYELSGVLGRGATGEVYRARHVALDRALAIKVLHRHVVADPDAVRRFRREARAAARLEHPNVVRVLDFGDDGATFYIVMEHLAGPSLAAWIGAQSAPPPLVLVQALMDQVFDALGAAHASGIVHRDLKPDNVLFTDEPAGRVKVVDFGLAHLEAAGDDGETLTRRDAVAGTPAYMSPEQCRSLRVSPSADLYAAGCLLTELLQLRPPFTAPSPADVISQQLFLPPPALERPAAAEPLPPLLEQLRLDLLAKRPHERPRDAGEARARLACALDGAANRLATPPRREAEPRRSAASWPTPAEAPLATPSGVALVALEGGLDLSARTGLAARGLVVHQTTLSALELRGATLLLLDVGADTSAAVPIVTALLARHPGLSVVVCGAAFPTATLTRLIEAGAADVARYPLDADRLAPKLLQLLRR